MSAITDVLIGCFFSRSVSLEGVGSLVRGLAAEMRRRNLRVRLLLPEGHYSLSEGVELLTYRPGPLGLVRYRKMLSGASGDLLVLMENNPAMGFSWSAGRGFGQRVCVFYSPLQGFGLIREMGLTRQALLHAVGKNGAIARVHDWSDRRCIVGSEFQARQLRALGAAQVQVLPVCGLSQAQPMLARESARVLQNWDRRPVVGYMGHFSRAKGVDVLVKAFSRYAGPARLALAHSGKGRLSKHAQRLLNQMLSEDRAILLGEVDVTNFLAACDVVALPYITSSIFHQPQVMLESFAASTAVLTSRVGGLAELVWDGQTGRLVDARDVQAMTDALAEMTKDLDATHELGRQGRRLFDERCSTESFVTHLLEMSAASIGRGRFVERIQS